MDAYSLHLQFNYFPVIGTFAGILMLALGLWRESDKLRKTGLWILIAVAVLILPVYVSGEITGAGYPIVAVKDLIGQHRLAALPGFILIETAGLAAIAALFLNNRRPAPARRLVWLVLAMTILGSAFLVRAALVGRQIKFGAPQVGIESNRDFFETATTKTTELGEKLWLV
jgi:hypothetical protein